MPVDKIKRRTIVVNPSGLFTLDNGTQVEFVERHFVSLWYTRCWAFCVTCDTMFRRVDRQHMVRCPRCNQRLRHSPSNSKESRRIREMHGLMKRID